MVYVVVSLPVCGRLLVLRPLVYISGIHDTISNLIFILHLLVYVIKVCVYSLTTPPNFFKNYNSVHRRDWKTYARQN